MDIRLGDFNDPQVKGLLNIHFKAMHDQSPVEHIFALDISGLQKPDLQFYTLWDKQILLACGAIQLINANHAELKSMRTHPDHLRKGAASQILQHLLKIAQQQGYSKLSLETGTHPSFEPAIQLYKKFGFIQGKTFSNYKDSQFNQFFHLSL